MNKKLKEALNTDLKEYRSIPFWSWNNSLDEDELCRQIEDMYNAGTGGFIMHARTGLKDEYLGEKWFSCIDVCLKKAKELNMEAWIYDENGWPSGFVGGKLLNNKAYLARFLEDAVGDYDSSSFVTFVKTQNGFSRADSPISGEDEYHNIYLRVSPSNVDILNPEVTDAFITETHEKYYERFKDSFGKELAGFFTDEPQFYRFGTPYSLSVELEFAKDGQDVKDGLIWLFVKDERGYAFRQRYYDIINRLYVENFYKKIYGWCDSHNCMLTGHSIEESWLGGQMWGAAAVMPTYEYEHIPAIDWLGRNCGSELSPRQVASVAAQLGKKIILTETFACSGYDVTPTELKSIGEYQYFNGINKMCQHLYPYSLAARGKTDHPPVFSPHGNWFESFKIFNDYFARLGCIVGETKDVYDVAIIHPMRELWLDYVYAEDYRNVKDAETAFNTLLMQLRKHGVCYHFIDEKILSAHGYTDGNSLVVGNCRYDTVIVPQIQTLTSSTYELLKAFKGNLCVLGDVRFIDGVRGDAQLKSNLSLDRIISNGGYGFSCEDGNSFLTARKGDFGEFVFIKNLSLTEKSRVHISGASKNYFALDLETISENKLESDDIVLDSASSIILIKDPSASPDSTVWEEEDVTGDFCINAVTDNYLVLDYAQTAIKQGEFGEYAPITKLFEELLRQDYKGEVFVRQTFNVKEKMPLTLVMEKAKLKTVELNSNKLLFTQSDFDVNFVEAELGNAVRIGENQLVYSFDFWQHEGVHFTLFDPLATESLKNCLYYDTSIEQSYIKGDFVVGQDFALKRRKAFPPINSQLYKEGYPFFKGELTLEGTISYNGKGKVLLNPQGRYMTARVEANGRTVDIVFNCQKDISPVLEKGNNKIKITLKSSLRNLLGPHHWIVPEPIHVSPYNFEFRGGWSDGTPQEYTPEYHFIPFGIDKIMVKKEV